MQYGLLNQIQFKLHSLTEAEQLVAHYVMTHPEEVVYLSTQELAKRANVSNATVTRFCKSVGAKGFPDFKIMLSSEHLSVASIQKEIKPSDTLDEIKEQLTLRMTTAIKETELLVDNDAIESSVKLVKKAEEVVVYGIGASFIVAKDITQKLIRIGKSTFNSQDLHLIVSALAAKPKKKVVILISNSGEKRESNLIASVCNELGIPVISIVSNPESSLAAKSTVSLIHSQTEAFGALRSAATTSIVVQHYIVDLLYYHFLSENFDENIAKLNDTYNFVNNNLT